MSQSRRAGQSLDPEIQVADDEEGAPSRVKAVPRLYGQLLALKLIFSGDKPGLCLIHGASMLELLYIFGDASGAGFGSSWNNGFGLGFCFGVWGEEGDGTSSNFRELQNLVETLESLGLEGKLAGKEKFIFTDNMVSESVASAGSSSSEQLYNLVARLVGCLGMRFRCSVHFIHVAGSRMISQGSDGLSWGDLYEGVMSGKLLLSFIPLADSALYCSSALCPWIQGWASELKADVKFIDAEGWFERGHDILGGDRNVDGVWIPSYRPASFVWSPPLAAARIATEEIRQARQKCQLSAHVVVPCLMWFKSWRKQIFKSADLIFDVPAGCKIWEASMHEPLIFALYFPYLSRSLWELRKSPLLVALERRLHQVFKMDYHLGGCLLSQFCCLSQRMDSMSLCELRRVLRSKPDSVLPDQPGPTSPTLSFPINWALGDESQCYKRCKEDEKAFLVARNGDWMLSPFQCKKCWFVNLCDRLPVDSSPRDDHTLALLRRVNLDIFWTRVLITVHDMVRLTKKFVQTASESGRNVNLPSFDPWRVGDQVGMEVALQMLEKTLQNGRHGRNYQQFDLVCPLRAAMSDLYSASFSGHEARYSLKSHRESVLHMYEGPMQSAFMERFVRGLKIRMPAASNQDKRLNGKAVKFILDWIELKWSDPDTSVHRARELLMAASYICVAYGYSLKGHEAFWVNCDRLVKFIHVGKADTRTPHVIVAALGRFKGEDGDRMHLFPMVNETKSGIRIRVWLERLAALLRSEGKSLCPAFCDDKGYQLSLGDIERVFHPILEELQGREGPMLSGLVPAGINVREHYRCNRSFRRGAESKALDNGVDSVVINFVDHWSRFEKRKGKQPGFDMMEHYASGSNTRYMQLSFGEGI